MACNNCQCDCPDPAAGKLWGPQVLESKKSYTPDPRPVKKPKKGKK